jgi:hypothetical protein
MGHIWPYSKAPELLAEFLPVQTTEGHVSPGPRTMRATNGLQKSEASMTMMLRLHIIPHSPDEA